MGDLDRYDVWGRLSAGGMSEVFLARHRRLAIPVAIKALLADLREHGRLAETVLRSAQLMARVASPHVVRILDVGEVDAMPGARPELPPTPGSGVRTTADADIDAPSGTTFIVEEYVDGVDLGELGAERRSALRLPLPLWAAARFTAEAAEGLHAAHQAGVLHRDVKPANLFLTSEGQVKVGDFGVAVEARRANEFRPAGTLDYMAPEMSLGDPVDRRADLYSLGATAFALRYGMPPFASRKEACLPDVAPRFPPAATPYEAFFQHVLGRLLTSRPDARPHNARSVARVLRRLSRPLAPKLPILRLTGGDLDLDGTRVVFELGDIARASADVIVNSAYSSMTMDGGVGRALVDAGGQAIADEALAHGEQALGSCVATTAGALDAQEILHAVSAWNEVSCVARATHRALVMAESKAYARIAMPAIGTGQGGVAIEACAQAIASVLELHLQLGGSRLEELRLVLHEQETLDAFREVFAGVFVTDDHRAASQRQDTVPASAFDFAAPTVHATSGD